MVDGVAEVHESTPEKGIKILPYTFFIVSIILFPIMLYKMLITPEEKIIKDMAVEILTRYYDLELKK